MVDTDSVELEMVQHFRSSDDTTLPTDVMNATVWMESKHCVQTADAQRLHLRMQHPHPAEVEDERQTQRPV
jgi:hypothetical protein